MNSKNHEEVRRRRAKASTSRLNLYQKLVLVAGVLTLFLAIGISPRLAPFLAAGVVGVMLLLFLILKTCKRKVEAENKAVSQETSPDEEETLEAEPIVSTIEGKQIPVPPEVISEQKDLDPLPGNIFPELKEAVTPPPTPPEEKDESTPIRELSGDGVLAQIQERLAKAEEKIARLEDRVLDLEEKAASYQEGQEKSGPKIDLQTILSHLDEKDRKAI